MKHGYMERGSYPVDAHGFAVPVWETAVPCLADEYETNHHYNYYARTFGQLAIAQTFRDLASQQIMLPDRSHVILHQMYSGIRLPDIGLMLDSIEGAQFTGEKLHVREPFLGYQLHDITDDLMNKLYQEYNSLNL